MVKVCKNGVWIIKGREIIEDSPLNRGKMKNLPLPPGNNYGGAGSIAEGILLAHDMRPSQKEVKRKPKDLKLSFDAITSHDITYVNIIQTAKLSGLTEFPLPYIMTNCHNSLCAVGGTINADDHSFGLSAAKKYGGIYVPPHLAVIHSYMREEWAGGGRMILGSDSHTRYGALGTMGVGEGGGELVKQLLGQPCELAWPRIIAVFLTGKPAQGIGPQDLALAIIGEVFKDGFAKNAVLEFLGDGIKELSQDFRSSLDVMTTETGAWSSIWETDNITKSYFSIHRREEEYRKLFPETIAYYDGMIYVDLSTIKPMIALPFHPSNVFELDTVISNAADIFRQLEKDFGSLNLMDHIDSNGKIRIDQAIIAGCAGGSFENIMAVKNILEIKDDKSAQGDLSYIPNDAFSFSVYPGSQPILLELSKNGAFHSLVSHGVIMRSAFCGPCFGAGDVPPNNGLSIRHTTRNFPNREGSKPGDGQISSVCLMDARSIAATVLNNGYLTSIKSLDWEENRTLFSYDSSPYKLKVYNGAGKSDKNAELKYGPNISDFPPMEKLGENLLVKIVSFIDDPVTTTDELIPSGETSSLRSNPVKLAEFTLSRKDPSYVGKAKAVRDETLEELPLVYEKIESVTGIKAGEIQHGSAIFARKPGDGSAREQAASCQRVLGGLANFANEYATKRYRSNLINWGMLPFIVEGEPLFKNGDYIFMPGIARSLREEISALDVYIIDMENGINMKMIKLPMPELNSAEKELILSGCLINLNRVKTHNE